MVELVEENSDEIPSCSANHLGDESESEGYDFLDMISFRKIYQVQNHIIIFQIISQHRPKRHSLPSGKTLEILLIQEELGLIFKEKVFLSLVMIHCYPRPVI